MATLNVIFVLSNQGLFSLMPRALLIARSSALFMVCPYCIFCLAYFIQDNNFTLLRSLITLHYLKLLKKIRSLERWLRVKNTYCSGRGPKFDFHTHIRWLPISCNASPKGFETFFCSPGALLTHAHTHIPHTHIIKIIKQIDAGHSGTCFNPGSQKAEAGRPL